MNIMPSMPLRPMVTTHAHEAIAIAHRHAGQLGHRDLTPAHVVLGILSHHANMGAQVLLYSCQVERDALERDLEASLPSSPDEPRGVPPLDWTPADEAMLKQAVAESYSLGTEHVGCQHLLLGFLRDTTGTVAEVLARHGIQFDRVRQDVERIYAGTMIWAAADQGPDERAT